MKIYNLIISNEKWTSVQAFGDKEKALKYVEDLESGQAKLEGKALKYIFHYSEKDIVTLPFFAQGKRIYCSHAWTSMTKPFQTEDGVWRAIYEQEID